MLAREMGHQRGPPAVSDKQNSCFIEKLSYYIALGETDREILARFEKEERDYTRGEVISQAGQPISDIHVVRRGWLFTSTTLPDGRRQLLRLHFPGDMVGLAETPLTVSPHELQTATDVSLCPFPKSEMDHVFRHSPRLTALFFSFVMVDQLVLLDRIRVLGRMSARERIAHFLLEICSRLRITNPTMDCTFRLPLTQGQIADAVGLTNVYVSKSLSRLREDGFVSFAEGQVTIEREQAMREMCDFEDRYRSIDVNWFPDVHED